MLIECTWFVKYWEKSGWQSSELKAKSTAPKKTNSPTCLFGSQFFSTEVDDVLLFEMHLYIGGGVRLSCISRSARF